MKSNYITGNIETPVGNIEQVSTVWSNRDIWSTIKVRWSIGRMDYTVAPGLYAVGTPDHHSEVYVSCNFKLSFDHLRRALHGINGWILVLDTKGVNVWCAAGKGTFGTKELVFRINKHDLTHLVSHKRLIVPQLGATGVSAYKVNEATGFKVLYGPVRAKDIPSFITSGFKATPEMRKVMFNVWERMKLIPVELVNGRTNLLMALGVFFILSGFNRHGFSVDSSWNNGGKAVINLCVAYFSGCILTPLLLPLIPFKNFSLKGLTVGWLLAVVLFYFGFLGTTLYEVVSWFLLIGGVSSFLSMNFTGSTTFTSLSGVQKEMKYSLPAQIGGTVLGFAGWFITRFI